MRGPLVSLPSTKGSWGVVIKGNGLRSEPLLTPEDSSVPSAAVVLQDNHDVEISGNACQGRFEHREWAFVSGPAPQVSFTGQDMAGHQLLGDLRFGIVRLTASGSIDERAYTVLVESATDTTIHLPALKMGKRVLVKNIGTGRVTVAGDNYRIDADLTYPLDVPWRYVEVAGFVDANHSRDHWYVIGRN